MKPPKFLFSKPLATKSIGEMSSVAFAEHITVIYGHTLACAQRSACGRSEALMNPSSIFKCSVFMINYITTYSSIIFLFEMAWRALVDIVEGKINFPKQLWEDLGWKGGGHQK